MLNPSQRNKIIKAFENAKELAEFASSERWLTYYLSSSPKNLEAVGSPLATARCFGLEDWDSGFLYVKQPCADVGSDVVAEIENVLTICSRYSVDALHIDLDTSLDVQRSRFKCLIEFDN